MGLAVMSPALKRIPELTDAAAPAKFLLTESPRAGKVALARSLGQPFAESTVATWQERGRKYLDGAAAMERLNASWDVALAGEDIEVLGRLLGEAEAVFAGGLYDVEAVFAAGQEPARDA